jgi:hypothetical protein
MTAVVAGAPMRAPSAPPRPSSGARRRFLRDRFSGVLDGRRGLPAVAVPHAGLPTVVPTGHLLAIWSLAAQQLDDRHRAMMAQTADDRVELASAPPRREYLEQRIRDYSARLDQNLAAGPARERRMGEQDLTAEHVARRRRNEQERRIRHLRKEITQARTDLVALETRQLQLAARIETALAVAQGDAQAIGSRADRRVASYLKGACRTHPDAHLVVAASAALRRPEPEWTRLHTAQDLITTAEEDAT